MINGHFALLWSSMLTSSLWIAESKETRLLFITMLVLKNKDGQILGMGLMGLADRAKLTLEETAKSLKVLVGVDKNDHSGVDGGRRVREIEGGWEVVNHEMYGFTSDAKREFWRLQKEEERRRKEGEGAKGKLRRVKKPKRAAPLPGEALSLRAEERGEDYSHIVDNSYGQKGEQEG
jgi:hypothetical protein